jgi:hypothetical protein
MIGPEIHRFLSIGLILLIFCAGIAWGTQAFADNHCDNKDDKKCNHTEKNQKSTHKDPVITTNPNSGPLATLITVTGNGFDPLSSVVISFKGDTRGTVIPNSTGGFGAIFNVPSTSSIGDHIVKASQGTNSASKTFKVTDIVNPKATQGFNSSSKTNTDTSSAAHTITLNSTSEPVGASVNITGAGFDPNSTVAITFNDTAITTTPTSVTTSNIGEFFANFIVPLSSSVGFVQVVATQGSNSASETFIVTSSLVANSQPNVSATAPSSPNLSENTILPDIFG